MAISRPQLDERTRDADTTLAKALAPEDIHPGDYVGLLYVVYELPSFLWCTDATISPREELVRIQFVPEHGGVPLKVISVCLPYVLVKRPRGQQQTLDVRRSKLARLDANFAKIAWKALRCKRAKKKKIR